MNRRAKYAVGILLAALALLLPSLLQAQSPLTLESLAQQIKVITDRLDDGERAERSLGAKIAALENRIAQLEPTSTPEPTATQRPTRRATRRPTPRPTATAMSQGCNLAGVPDPPSSRQRVNCEAWGITYKLITLATGRPIDNMLPRVLREFYPLVVDSARNCRVSPTRLGDLVYRGSEQLERLGKPAEGSAIGYLLGAMSEKAFTTVVDEAGGCLEAIVMIIVAAE